MGWRVFRIGVAGVAAGSMLFMAAGQALAHPADEGRQNVTFSIQNGRLTWAHEIWLGPLLGQPMWTQEVDTDGDGIASPAEQQTFVDNLRSMIELRIDGKAVPMKLESNKIDVYEQFISQPAQPQISLTFSAPISAGAHSLAYRTMIDTHRIKFAARFASGNDVEVSNPNADAEHYNADLTIQPTALSQSQTAADALPGSTGADFALSPAISDLIKGSNFSPLFILLGLLISFGVGALHALTPGHGKGIIAATMVGERGKFSHVLTLAGTMTITHTSSVIVLGLIALLASRVIMPQVLTPWLTLLSGVLILVVGGSLLWQRVHTLKGEREDKGEQVLAYAMAGEHGSIHDHVHADEVHTHTHAHKHVDEHGHISIHEHAHEDAHEHDHPHTHEHDEGHVHGFVHTHDGHTHQHLTIDDVRNADHKITLRSLVVLGISGGLLPCADALAILLLSVSVNRIVLGLVLLVAFSAGIALTLTAIGLIAAGGQRVLRRYNRLEPLLARLPIGSAVVVLVLGIVITYEGVLAVSFLR